MINQSTYENLSVELIVAAETLINEVGTLLVNLNNSPSILTSRIGFSFFSGSFLRPR